MILRHFQDHPEFGVRQLDELGFADGDLLISSTEGGETPFVIGATERAAAVSSNPPWFLYCNPDEKLARLVERSASRVVRLQTGQVRTYLAWSLATLLVLLWIIS